MTLILSAIENPGDLNRERLVMRADGDVDIGRYAVFLCLNAQTLPASGNIPRVYWFMDKPIKRGDFVVLYSKAGKRSEKIGTDGASSSFFFYWASESPLLIGEYIPVLVNTAKWSVIKRLAPEPEAEQQTGQT